MARAQAQTAEKTAGAPRARAAVVAPSYASTLKTARMAVGGVVTDRSGAERIDLCNAEGAVLLGWADARVENAVANAGEGKAVHAEAAERIGMLLPCAEAVAFRSHLNHALADALCAAKTLTGRDGAFFCDDETVSAGRHRTAGRALERHAGQVAALVIRPMEANRAFLAAARRASQRDGVLLVFDESRTAFRVHTRRAPRACTASPPTWPSSAPRWPTAVPSPPSPAVSNRCRLLPPRAPRRRAAALAAACATLDRVARERRARPAHPARRRDRRPRSSTRFIRTGAAASLGVYGDPTWSLIAASRDPGFDGEALDQALARAPRRAELRRRMCLRWPPAGRGDRPPAVGL